MSMRKRITLLTTVILLTLAAAACTGGDEPPATSAPPTATLAPVPVVTATPPPATPTAPPTPSPAPTDDLPDPAGFSDTATLISWLRDAYSQGLDPAEAGARLTAACWSPRPEALRYAAFEPVWAVDVAGSGTPQWLVTVRALRGQRPACSDDAFAMEAGVGGLWVVDGGGLLYELSPLDTGFWQAPRVAGAVDLSGDGAAEVVVESMGCGAHTCSSAFFVLSAHGGTGIRSVIDLDTPLAAAVGAAAWAVDFTPLPMFAPDNARPLTSATADFADVTGDGVADLSLRGGGIGSVGAGLHRTYTEVWSWEGRVLTLRDFIWHNAPARHHALYAANYYYNLGERDLAREYYLRVIDDETLSDEFAYFSSAENILAAGRSATQQFAAFRLAMMDVEDGRLAEAAAWADWLASTYPGAPISVAAGELLTGTESGRSLAESCARITLFLQGEPRPTGVLDGEVGYGNPDLTAGDVCPVGRDGQPAGLVEPVHEPAPVLGVAAVDAAVAAALAGDGGGLAAQVALRSYACVESGMGALLCEPGETPGTPVDGFVISGCDGYVERDRARIDAVLADAAAAAGGLVGVAVNPDGSEYRVGLATTGAGKLLYVDDAGIYGVNLGCDRPAAAMLTDRPDDTFLLAPPGE